MDTVTTVILVTRTGDLIVADKRYVKYIDEALLEIQAYEYFLTSEEQEHLPTIKEY